MKEDVMDILEESRKREKAQTLFYRRLAASAEDMGNPQAAERLNALLADEQHHLARLTARILELDQTPASHDVEAPPAPPLESWESMARQREEMEVSWYRDVLEEDMDPETRDLFKEIFESESHHARELGGKWMSA